MTETETTAFIVCGLVNVLNGFDCSVYEACELFWGLAVPAQDHLPRPSIYSNQGSHEVMWGSCPSESNNIMCCMMVGVPQTAFALTHGNAQCSWRGLSSAFYSARRALMQNLSVAVTTKVCSNKRCCFSDRPTSRRCLGSSIWLKRDFMLIGALRRAEAYATTSFERLLLFWWSRQRASVD